VVLKLLRIELDREAKLELTVLIWRERGSSNTLVNNSEIDSKEVWDWWTAWKLEFNKS
jgi:hypothetical protein